MKETDCVELLRWALPRLGLRWAGFRRVRRQVCRRVDRRLRELGLADVDRYRAQLEAHPEEWTHLDALCHIPISRFYRDRGTFDHLRETVLPELAAAVGRRGEAELRVWSAGCASGEEPYTLGLIWSRDLASRFPDLRLRVLATDADPALLERARRGLYRRSSLRELPPGWIDQGFEREGELFRIRDAARAPVELHLQDIRKELPGERFHAILCRNLVFTYFDDRVQRRVLARLVDRLEPGGVLVVGAHESLPPGDEALRPDAHRGFYRGKDGLRRPA